MTMIYHMPLYRLPHQLPRLPRKPRGVVDLCLCDVAFAVRPVCKLVDIRADTRQHAQKLRVAVRRTRFDGFAQNTLADHGAGRQTAALAELHELAVFRIIQPNAGEM